jgi:hypothetical protein
MVLITYAQYWHQNSRGTSGSYFYVRTHSLKEFDFTGQWDLSEGSTFSVYRSEYWHFPQSIEFWICSVSSDFNEDRISIYPSGNVASVQGKFNIIAQSDSKTYAPRLMSWWNTGDGSIAYAQLCAKYLKPRITKIPQFELDKLIHLKPDSTDLVLGGNDAFQKWLSTAAVLGGNK